jgi:ATP synthase mitochondrial F1 complex assembly factor 1
MHGVESVEELKFKLKEEIDKKKKQANILTPLMQDFEQISVTQKSGRNDIKSEVGTTTGERKLGKDKKVSSNSGQSLVKDLNTFIDVAKLALHDPKEIELIWKSRFAGKKNGLCGAVNGLTFSRIYKNSRRYPIFLLPLPVAHKGTGDDGWELHYVQWNLAGPTTLHCIITSLAEYKLHQDFATPHTTLIFHSELLPDKQIVLMNGTVDDESKNVGEDDATFLALQVQRFYGVDESSERGLEKIKLMESFNSGNNDFVLDDLLEEIQKAD